ncbi:hypothetical protein C8J56DRAFT_511370 [Mycena floridula]|nr:hypothetical protein C8J56DRAFT_511370 [Mycena floridula]
MPVVTRRAALAQRSILNVLPNELTTEIISLCDCGNQAALCRVSKRFKELAHRLLYQIVDIEDVSSVISFDRVVSDNPQYATWVRELIIGIPDDGASGTDVDALDATNRILQSTTELRVLVMHWWKTDIISFQTFSFPHLHILKLSGDAIFEPEQPNIAPFVSRHPTISQLVTYLFDDRDNVHPAPLINLPNITRYQGMSLDFLANTPKLRSAHLLITKPDALNVFARFCGCQDLGVDIDSFEPQVIRDLFDCLQRHLPHLKSFFLYTHFAFNLSSYQNLVQEGLSGLKQLESFGLVNSRFFNVNIVNDNDLNSIVDLWLKSCPTLQECLIEDSGRERFRYEVVRSKAQRRIKLCRMETLFD